jgi:hypothetical protein
MEPLISPFHPSRLFDANRRVFLTTAGLSWLTPVGHLLARQAERKREPAKSVILLWLGGGPSQLETFDPHPNSAIAGGTKAVSTSIADIELADGLPRLAEQLDKLAIVRSAVSKEGDHERGTYMMKTGYRPDPTIEHPSIGAICCHELPGAGTDIPRHVTILPGQWVSRGGFLGGEFDAFQVGDPKGELPDIASMVPPVRDSKRVQAIDVVDQAFARGRRRAVEATLHGDTLARARLMMSSPQLRAFDISEEPASVQAAYGDTPFGRGCLAARRLIEVGARCVEVTLDGWDSHANNHEVHAKLNRQLDPAFSALLIDLAQRALLEHTIVLCMGEFGRTPKLNFAGGRDHWPSGFSIALAGGGLRSGITVGATDPDGSKPPTRPVPVEDIHATVLKVVGLIPGRENIDPATTRPIKLSSGRPIEELIRGG